MTESLLSKLDRISFDLQNNETDLEKCMQSSRTKKEIVVISKRVLESTTKTRKKIEGYRSALDNIVAGEDRNTLHDEILAIGEDIGNALFYLQQGKINEASKILVEINHQIRGY